MADIRDTIRAKYDIDIKTDNIIKLYKIDSADISAQDLETKIADRRKKWNQSINGANEKFAERDRAYLGKADKFEAILRDEQLRKELFNYHSGKKGSENVEVSKLVKKYFGLITSTTKVGKAELDFFLKYFPEEKKNKKSILEFLKKEYKIIIASIGGDKEEKEEQTTEETDDSKKKSSAFIVNLFTEKTLIQLRQCELNLKAASESEQVLERYPDAKKSLYEYLEIGKFKTRDDFKEYVNSKKKEVYDVRQEFGTDYIPLVDLFNGLAKVVENDDVRDNFAEFKLLVMYPILTPYMYEIGEVKKNTLDELYNIASEEYNFRSVSDFLVSYFNIVYDNFGIYEDSIKKIMADAEKQAGKEKALNALSSFLGKTQTRKLPKELHLVYTLAYWPIHVLAILFKVGKFVIEKLRYFGVATGVLICIASLIAGKEDFALMFRGWGAYLKEVNGLESTNFLLQLLSSIEAIIKIAFTYLAPGSAAAYFFWQLSVNLRKRIDLKGIERSLDAIIDNAKKRIIEQNEDGSNDLMKKKLPMIITNAVGFVIILAVVLLIVLAK